MLTTRADLFDLAQRFIGVKEITGQKNNPLIVWMLQLSDPSVIDDETPWCGGFPNMIAWMARCARSKSNGARTWLKVGIPISLGNAEPGDIVVLMRGTGDQPGPEVIKAPGHVGFFAALHGPTVFVLGGNQKNEVNVSPFETKRVLGVRRLIT